jgi:hypothetical protein
MEALGQAERRGGIIQKRPESNDGAFLMRQRFQKLLHDFTALLPQGSLGTAPLTSRIRTLLDQYGEHRKRADTLKQARMQGDDEAFHNPSRMQSQFATLLNSYGKTAIRDRESQAGDTDRIRIFLDQFIERRDRVDTLEQARTLTDRDQFHALLDGYYESAERYRLQQEQAADDFNLLDVMRLTGKEIRHSMVLAWLLDRDMRNLGTHAQGTLGFRLFLEELNYPVEYADGKYWVNREVAGDESIVDIEIGSRGRFLIHIENKIWSCEGTDQTDREWSDLQRRARDLNVNTPDIHALFLTPYGTQPANTNFRAIPWGRIVRILEKFASQAKPSDVKLFASHYARALKRFIVFQQISEDDNGEATP